LHAEFAVTLYREFCNDLSEETIKDILLEALELEKEFTKHALPDRLSGINQDLMNKYLEFVTDTWLQSLGCKKVFNGAQPFAFMATIGQKRKDNFHEKTRTNYGRQTEQKQLDFSMLTF
jgi:ribonucleoside-diphosphate reductase beta chain